MTDSGCTLFEPQTYLKDRCKKCFRLRSKHTSVLPSSSAVLAPSPSSSTTATNLRPVERRMSWRDKIYADPTTTTVIADSTEIGSMQFNINIS